MVRELAMATALPRSAWEQAIGRLRLSNSDDGRPHFPVRAGFVGSPLVGGRSHSANRFSRRDVASLEAHFANRLSAKSIETNLPTTDFSAVPTQKNRSPKS